MTLPGPITLAQCAERLGLAVEPAWEAVTLHGVAGLAEAGPQELAFVEDERRLPDLLTTRAGAVLVPLGLETQVPPGVPTLPVKAPKLAYARLLQTLLPHGYGWSPAQTEAGVHPTATVGAGCQVDPSAVVGAYAVLGQGVVVGQGTVVGPHACLGHGVQVGQKSVLGARVTLHDGVALGARCRVGSGAVLGSQGFGYVPDSDGAWATLPQVGRVRCGDDVHIGANTTIDCGAQGDTVLEDGVKLDNQVQVAHNVHIGPHTLISGCTGVAGSTKVGAHCLIGGGCRIGGHLTLADRVVVAGGTTVLKSLTQPGIYCSAIHARPRLTWHRAMVRLTQLDRLFKRLEPILETSP